MSERSNWKSLRERRMHAKAGYGGPRRTRPGPGPNLEASGGVGVVSNARDAGKGWGTEAPIATTDSQHVTEARTGDLRASASWQAACADDLAGGGER